MKNRIDKTFPFPVPVIAVFIAANGLIGAPFSGGSLLGFSAALLLGIILLPLLLKVFKKIRLTGGIVFKATALFLAIAAFLPAVTAYEYCEFVYKAVLPHADMWLIIILFAACVLYLALSNDSALYKFAFLSFVLNFAVVAALFTMSAKTFDFKNLSSAFKFSSFSFKETGEYACKLILPAAVAVLFLSISDKNTTVPQVLCGGAAGALFSAIVVLDSVLSFGLPLAAKLDYPYIDDISTVTVGSLFTRMDALAYFIFFAAYVLKCAVCVKTSARLISRAEQTSGDGRRMSDIRSGEAVY
ncbi:MAG: GerAB/ArcD/ProY family transporter [Clostridia bacterium]|nr:GerAB/ArcD/ProY family transporter [Clostridia bacterium]